ncbi:hypothetical protein BJX70DRAFT_386635 [Aspergillus crustosus]
MHRSQRRSTKVCTRCRQRKTKCDFKLPQCTSCALANAACLGYDPVLKQAVPRSLVKSLEARVAQLEAQLLAFQSAPHTLPYSMACKIAQASIAFGLPTPGPYLQSKLSSTLFLRPSCPPLAVSPGSRGADEVNIQPGELSSHEKRRIRHKATYKVNMINLGSVPHSALERMVRNYTDTHLPQYPIIPTAMLDNIFRQFRHETQSDHSPSLIPDILESAGLGHFEYFVAFIVLAISASTLTWRAETQAREACDSFYKSALKHLQLLEEYNEIREIQISLLLAHFAHMCPELVDNWTCISHAVRVVLSLGLYREFPENLDVEQRKLRSELFWVTYGMERSLCTNLRLPFIDDVKKKSSASHISRYRMLETEVHRVLYLEEELLMFGFTSVEEWSRDVTCRLEAWYTEAQTFTPYNMLEFKHVQFHHLVARIYRPTPRLRTKTPQDWVIVLKSSRKLIDDYVGQERRRRLFYPWHGVHILFETASIALEASWSARNYPPLIFEADEMLKTHIPRCLQLLGAIGERWNEATECVNKLSPLVQKVCSAFSGGDSSIYDTSIAEEINGLLFSDKPPMWNLSGFDVDDFAFEGGPFLLDNMLVDEMDFLQWGADWAIMPAETYPEGELA